MNSALPVLRKGVFALLAVALSGCLNAPNGASRANAFFADAPRGFALGRSRVRTIELAGGAVTASIPKGLCQEKTGSDNDLFALLSVCTNRRSSALPPVLITIAVSPAQQILPDSAMLESSLSEIGEVRRNGDAYFVLAAVGGDQIVPSARPSFWRTAQIVNDRVVTLAAYGSAETSESADQELALLGEITRSIQSQPTTPDAQVVVAAPMADAPAPKRGLSLIRNLFSSGSNSEQ